MNRFEIIFTAVMATIIVHLLFAVVFMSDKSLGDEAGTCCRDNS